MQGSKINGNSSQCWGINYMDSTGYWTLSLVHIPDIPGMFWMTKRATSQHPISGVVTIEASSLCSLLPSWSVDTHPRIFQRRQVSLVLVGEGAGFGATNWVAHSCPTICAMINGLIYVYFYLLSFTYDLKSGDPEIVSLDMVQLLGSMSSNLMGASQNLLVVASAIEDLEENLSTLRLQYNKNIFATNGHAYLIS